MLLRAVRYGPECLIPAGCILYPSALLHEFLPLIECLNRPCNTTRELYAPHLYLYEAEKQDENVLLVIMLELMAIESCLFPCSALLIYPHLIFLAVADHLELDIQRS